MYQQEVKDEHYHSEINFAKKKHLGPIKWEDTNKNVDLDKVSFSSAYKNNLKSTQNSRFLKVKAKIDQKYQKGLYSMDAILFGNDSRLRQKIDDQVNAKKYQSHNFDKPYSLKPNDKLTISYWVDKDLVPDRVTIKAKDPISLIVKKHTYKIKY